MAVSFWEGICLASGRLPEKMSLDNGYQSGKNLEPLENAQVDACVAVDRGEKCHGEPAENSNRQPIVFIVLVDNAYT